MRRERIIEFLKIVFVVFLSVEAPTGCEYIPASDDSGERTATATTIQEEHKPMTIKRTITALPEKPFYWWDGNNLKTLGPNAEGRTSIVNLVFKAKTVTTIDGAAEEQETEFRPSDFFSITAEGDKEGVYVKTLYFSAEFSEPMSEVYENGEPKYTQKTRYFSQVVGSDKVTEIPAWSGRPTQPQSVFGDTEFNLVLRDYKDVNYSDIFNLFQDRRYCHGVIDAFSRADWNGTPAIWYNVKTPLGQQIAGLWLWIKTELTPTRIEGVDPGEMW